MPIYEYSCEGCGNRFEKLVRSSEQVLSAECPSCGDHHINQEYSTFAARAGAMREAAQAPVCGGGMCGPGISGQGSCGSGMCGVN